MATLQDYLGITKLRDAWPKWKANIIAVNNQVIAHVAGTADKHAAENITYDGRFTGKTDIKAAIDRAKEEIDLIVVSASIDPEVAVARESLVKSETFATLGARLEESEQDLVSYKADYANILNFGGSADGTTSNVTALTTLANSNKKLVRFAKSSNNIYLFDSSLSSTVTDGMIWDVEPNVSISVPDIGNINQNLRVTRPTKIILSGLNSEYWLTPDRGYKPAFRPNILAQSEIDYSELESIDPSSGILNFRDVTWPTGDIFGTFTPTSTSVSGVQMDIPVDSRFKLALMKILPGQDLSAQFESLLNGGVTIVCLVRSNAGYHGLYVNTDVDSVPNYFDKYSGVDASIQQVYYPGLGTHASYAGYYSLWTLRVNSPNNFSILFNGIEIVNKTIDGEIIEGGFGAYYISGTPSIIIQDWVLTKNRKQGGLKPMSLAIFGDSRTTSTMPDTWPKWVKSYLDGFNGLRIHQILNYAVGGTSISDQASLCTSENIAPADVVIIDIGTNDIQAGTEENAFATVLTSMITTCQTAGKKVIIGIPDLFYERDQAGTNVGQNTANYEFGRGIRAKCMRVTSDMGCKIVDKMQALGPIIANYINPTITDSYASLDLDPIVFDSIHETAFGHQLISAAYSRAIAGLYMTRHGIQIAPTLLPTTRLSNGWTIDANSDVVKWRRNSTGDVSLIGIFQVGATKTDGTVFYNLDENIRPTQAIRMFCAVDTTGGHSTAMVNIDTNGDMSIYGLPSDSTWLDVSNISYASNYSM